MLLELIQGLFSLGVSLISFALSFVIAIVIGLSMTAKGRNGLLWGIAGFFFPWLIFIVFFIPAKVPKLHRDIRSHPAFEGKNPVVASIMALSAIVAKSDGQISKEEVQLLRRFVQQQFRISTEELNGYEGAFNYGKENPDNYRYFTDLLVQYRRYNILMAVCYLLVGMSMGDGGILEEEEQMLRRILTGLGLHEYEYQSIKNHYAGGSRSYGYGGYKQQDQRAYQQGPSKEALKKKYSDVLGVPVGADISTIKKAYRKMAKENHPDRMAQEGMPEGYIVYANQRISEINEAYDWLKENYGMAGA